MKRSSNLNVVRGAGITAALVCAATSASGQEAVRTARAGDFVRDAHTLALENQAYNLPAGPVSMRLEASMGLEYNDNITLSENNRTDDWINRPGVTWDSFMAFGGNHTAVVDLDFGYQLYGRYGDLDFLYLTPDSGVEVNLKFEDVTVNIHDRISHTQDPADEPTLSNVSEFGRIQNTGGIRADWSLDSVTLTFLYDNYLCDPTSSIWRPIKHLSNLLYGRVTYSPQERERAGLEIGGGFTDYSENVLNDNRQFAIGAFWENEFSADLTLGLSGGYVGYSFDEGGTIGDSSDPQGFYGYAVLQHQVCRHFTYAVSLGRQTQLGFTSNTIEMTYARWVADIPVHPRVVIQPTFLYDHSAESGAMMEKADRYGGGVRVGIQIAEGLALDLDYLYLTKESNLADRSYRQNRVSANLTYSF